MQHILDAVLADDTSSEDFAALEIPESYRAALVRKDEVDMFEGLTTKEKDPRKSLHVDDVPVPELAPGEAVATTRTGNCRDGKSSRGSDPAAHSPATMLNSVARATRARLRTLNSVRRDTKSGYAAARPTPASAGGGQA